MSIEGLTVDVLVFVSRKYSSSPMITGKRVNEKDQVQHPSAKEEEQ